MAVCHNKKDFEIEDFDCDRWLFRVRLQLIV